MNDRGPSTRRPGSDDDSRQRKQQVLTHGTSSAVHGIADALVIKDRDLFFLCRPDGEVPVDGTHGYGLYYDDCRYLRGYELRIGGDVADRLASSAGEGDVMAIELTNPELHTSKTEALARERLGLTWRRRVDAKELVLHDAVTIQNFGVNAASFPIELRFDAQFEDVFEVRGLLREHRGTVHEPAWRGNDLVFEYEGTDARDRRVTLRFDPAPAVKDGTTVRLEVDLAPQQAIEIHVDASVEMSRIKHRDGDGADEQSSRKRSAAAAVPAGARRNAGGSGDGSRRDGRRAGAHRAASDGVRGTATAGSPDEAWTGVRSDSLLLEDIVRRSLADLEILRSDNAGAEYYAAGIPWFVALFGRDSIITAIETLAYDPSVAEQTLRVLAAWQGTEDDDYREEQPGKILHELRVGELAVTGAIPHHPFYGSVDATPLFCLLVARHAAWTGRLDLFEELAGSIDAALRWIERFGDSDGDGFTDYQCPAGEAIVNQGWKDSGNGIVDADGKIATPPIALVEVQGYVYAAKREIADLYERSGDARRAKKLRAEADELRDRFEDRFWMQRRGTYALALQKGGRQAAVVSSNPGQALWTGIVSAERAPQVRDSLMSDAMFSGWGVRTLAEGERRFNPIGYHLGTVWPHDNAIIAAGLRRYGFDVAANRIGTAIVEAAARFDEYRLPEVFAGYARGRFEVPVHYPVACHPQAWAAGSVPYLLTTMLGLEPYAFEHRLRIARPSLLPFVDVLELEGLRVGEASCDLRFERTGRGVAVEVVHIEGELDVIVELVPEDRQAGTDDARSDRRDEVRSSDSTFGSRRERATSGSRRGSR